jgi:hypothetical protein
MRENQLFGGCADLVLKRQSKPLSENMFVGVNPVAECQKVKVQRPASPALQPLPAKVSFCLVQQSQQSLWVRGAQNLNAGVDIVRSGTLWETRRLEQPTDTAQIKPAQR